MNKEEFIFSKRWSFDHQYRQNLTLDLGKPLYLAGTDEAGRGALAGPIVVAAVVLPPFYDNHELRDSKKMTVLQRERLFHEIQEVSLSFTIEIIDHREVEILNPKGASKVGMIKCLKTLVPQPQYCLIDAEKLPGLPFQSASLIKGDDLSLHIAAASVLAKVTRDHIMMAYHESYPLYNFAKNKGYGTAEHLANLNEFGPCPIHRKTYQPVQLAIAKQMNFIF
ncbi:RNase HII [Entomoplasma freundtii]|uniref:Ribonuclease HII n=1 Tax=Entomoplasma freundtii TaxID=74700 RepID=A0A2K8NRL3_9MOLU|nr:ribonuclease HII [Entomoplasma freundtii]ATZ16417.1 ribonuclease HII [Entomoplasma freundtii]TDY56544.1 RNase HII [Entomoplasma freundtii]